MKKILMITLLALAACSENDGHVAGVSENTAIINGQTVSRNEIYVESTVAFIYETPDTGSVHSYCTGTLISHNLVLTAAHCTDLFERFDTKVFFGTDLPKSFDDDHAIEIAESLSHRDFSVDKETNLLVSDLAVVKLATGAPPGYSPVPVLGNIKKLKAGMPLTLVGWGITSEVKNLKALSMQKTVVEIAQIRDQELITDQTRDTGACNGDSGGPGFIETSMGLIVAGAVSGPEVGYEDCHHYGRYMLLTNFKSFLIYAAQTMQADYPQFLNY